MSQGRVWAAGAVAVCWAVAGAVASPAGAGAVAAGAGWGRAMPVPGLAARNAGDAQVSSVSCASAGNCVAGGLYAARRGGSQGFVAGETNGRWGQAVPVPGLAALSAGRNVVAVLVSCGSAGRCAAAGSYWVRSAVPGPRRVFVASQDHGRWGKAIPVPGLAALNTGGSAQDVNSLSCSRRRGCAAGGDYSVPHSHVQGFVVSQDNGRWGKAIPVPGLAVLNTGGSAQVSSVSCAPAGGCAAVGYYTDRRGHQQGFVVSQDNGRWGKAIPVPGLAALNTGGDVTPAAAEAGSVSCPSAGICATGGLYIGRHGNQQGFVAGEKNGRWGKAIPVPGLERLNTGGFTVIESVSCASPGNCAASGYYEDQPGNVHGFVASERHGRWGQATRIPGLESLNAGGDAVVGSVSCASAGNCAAGGLYTDRHGHQQGFVVTEKNGRWGKATEVPGLESLNKRGYAALSSLSCAPAGNCAAGGSYLDRRGHLQGFVVTQT